MSVNVTTGSNGVNPLNELITKFVLGATTIERGLMRVIPNQQNIVEISKFRTDADKLTALECTPSTPNDSMHKDFLQIATGGCQFYDTFCPEEDFFEDWSFLWATGRMTDSQAAPKIRGAIQETVIGSVQANLEKLIWTGDVDAVAMPWLDRFDGYVKILEADATVRDVTNIGIITVENIFQVLSDTKNASNAEMLERGNGTFLVSYKDLQKLYDAQGSADISKGVNVMDKGVGAYAGYKVVSCGIPENMVLFTNASSGSDSNLLGATWMLADTKGVKIERLQANSSEWFSLVKFRFGVNIMYGDDCAFYQGVVIP